MVGAVHGFFDIIQGSIRPDSIVINAIGPAQQLWPEAMLRAFTIIPNFFIAGVCAVIIGLLTAIWSGAFIDRKHGPFVILLLSIVLLLTEGGFGPHMTF